MEEIVAELSKQCKVKEVVLGNVCFGNDSIPVGNNGFTAYVAFGSVMEATHFPTEITVHGEEVRLWHRGKYECETCHEKGHSADHHDKVMELRAKVANRQRGRDEKNAKLEETKNKPSSFITFSPKY